MHSKVFLICAATIGPALSVALPQAAPSTDSAFKRNFLGNVSAATTEGSDLNDGPKLDLISLNNASEPATNYSASPYDLAFGYDLPPGTNDEPRCSPAYGLDLDRHSCFDAWRNTGLDANLEMWGPRGGGADIQYKLPYRFSSGQSAIKHRYYLGRRHR